MTVEAARLLEISIAVGGNRKPFGEVTLEEAESQAASLREASGFGHRSRVAAVAAAWRELAAAMHEHGATVVADLSIGSRWSRSASGSGSRPPRRND